MPEGWKTDPRGTNEAPVLFDLFAQPFRILGVEPTATNRQVQDAFAIAQDNRVALSDEVVCARQSILEPSQRLLQELSYPIDSPRAEVGTLYTVLSSNASSDELLL